MNYDFKKMQEIVWFAAVTLAIALLQVIVTLDPAEITDWRFWAISTGSGAMRGTAGAIVAKFITKS